MRHWQKILVLLQFPINKGSYPRKRKEKFLEIIFFFKTSFLSIKALKSSSTLKVYKK
jgi:hypothetical protein